MTAFGVFIPAWIRLAMPQDVAKRSNLRDSWAAQTRNAGTH